MVVIVRECPLNALKSDLGAIVICPGLLGTFCPFIRPYYRWVGWHWGGWPPLHSHDGRFQKKNDLQDFDPSTAERLNFRFLNSKNGFTFQRGLNHHPEKLF